jgi:hypothetical protein
MNCLRATIAAGAFIAACSWQPISGGGDDWRGDGPQIESRRRKPRSKIWFFDGSYRETNELMKRQRAGGEMISPTIVRHARHVTFQLAGVAIPNRLFREIRRRIASGTACAKNGMMNVIPARLVVLSATAAFEVRAVDRPSHNCEAQGRLRVVAVNENSLIDRSGRRRLGID